MFTTFDRYLLGRLMHTFVVLFVSAYGLYIVIDLFTNIDDFQENTASIAEKGGGCAPRKKASSTELFGQIVVYYAYRSFQFFEMAGPILIVISVITVLGLLRKNSETFPILAAGIPAFRMLKPLLLAAVILNGALIINQELIIPNIAVALQTPRGSRMAQVQKVEAVYDYSNYLMHIDGEQVLIDSQTLISASFGLTEPQLTTRSCWLTAEKARFIDASENTILAKPQSGWLLQNMKGVLDESILTEEGRQRIIPCPNGTDVFIVSDVSFDQLYNRGRNVQYLSSLQLIQRIQNPSTGPKPVLRQSIALHCRITRPLLCLINIAIALPLVLRRESHSLITNMAVCAGVLGIFYALAEGCFAMAGAGLIAADMGAWLPVILTESQVRGLQVSFKPERYYMTLDQLLQQYEQGPGMLRDAVSKASERQLHLHPVPGKWSIQQVVCHLADFEPIYADRMKRVLVEDNPTMFGGDPDVFAAGLHYEHRNLHEELDLISVVRRQMVRILRQTDVEDFQRTGVHSEAGPLTLETLLERITGHIPHHVKFIHDKIAAMQR